MKIPRLTDEVGPGKKVYFVRFNNKENVVKSDGTRVPEIWYRTESGFEFPIPLHETEGAEWLPEDNSTMFMRWIGKRILNLREEEPKT